MGSQRIRVRFFLEPTDEELSFAQDVPSRLVLDAATASVNPDYMKLFLATLKPILKQHEVVCKDASGPACGICGEATKEILQTPMSWLHHKSDPFIGVWVSPLCSKGACEFAARREITGIMSGLGGNVMGSGFSTATEILFCKWCGSTQQIKKCGACQMVGYCSKEHQKRSWKEHKKICTR